MNDKKINNTQPGGNSDKKIAEDEERRKSRKKIFILLGIALGIALILIIAVLILTFCRNTGVKEEAAEIVETVVETEEPGDEDIDEEPAIEEEPVEDIEEDPVPDDEEEPIPDEEEGPVPEDEEEPVPEEEEAAIIPTVSISVYEGPDYSPADDVCYYRVEAIISGTPAPSLSWNHADASMGSFGPNRIQINLDDPSEIVNLTATVTNSAGSDSDDLVISWGCNRPPTIDDIYLSGDLYIESTYPISAIAADPDGDILTYSWSTSGGSIGSPGTNPTNWLTPSYGGYYDVTVTVDDGRGGTDSRTETFEVIEPNNPPEPGEIIVKEVPGGSPAYEIFTNYDYKLDIYAFDPDGDPLNYYWEVTGGSLGNAYINPADWTAPSSSGYVNITVTVDDGRGGVAVRYKTVQVKYYIY